MRHSQQNASHKRKYEDLCAAEGREPAEFVTGGDSKAVARSVSPGRLPSGSQTPAAAQGTPRPAGLPARPSPKGRRSFPAPVDILPMETEIQNRPLAQWPAHTEKILKDSPQKPEKSGPTQTSSGLPGLSSVDINNFGDSINKNEGMSLKRRRVSFGGRLRPELFDENLPPNTPLKRGETPAKRRSLAMPTVLKKIVKENPQPSGQEPSTDISVELPTQSLLPSPPAPSPPGSSAERRRSGRLSSAPQQAGFPRRAGRKSGTLPSKRASISRSQHDILQMICSKRRSGASEANLIVAKSWADVVKLGAKQAQTKVVRPGPQRPVTRRQRRPDTPKKPADKLPSQFGTGHANSPCTIVIGRAHVARVSAPARPYRMLNNLALNSRAMDYNEDLSGLTEMFKTPVKERPAVSACPGALSDAQHLLGKQLEVNVLGEKAVPPTLETLGENVISRTPNAAKLHSPSPAFRRKSTRGREDVQTPGSSSEVTHVRNPTPCSGTVSGSKRLRRSTGLGDIQVMPSESENEPTQAELAGVVGRTPRKMPQEQRAVGERKDGEGPSRTCKESLRSRDSSERTTPLRRSSRSWGQKWESSEDLGDSRVLCQEPVNAESKATEVPCESRPAELARTPRSRRAPKTPPEARAENAERSAQKRPKRAEALRDDASAGVVKGAPGHGPDPAAFVTGVRKLPRTPRNKSQPLEDLTGFKELFQTPEFSSESLAVGKMTVGPRRTTQPELASPRTQPKMSLKQAGVDKELFALGGTLQTAREAVHTPKAPRGDGKDSETFRELAKQKMDAAPAVSGSKRGPKAKTPALEDLTGLKELFQTPGHASNPLTVEKITEILGNLPQPELTQTPTRLKSGLKTSLGKVNIQEELLELRKLTEPSEESLFLPQETVHAEKGIKAFTETPKQKAYSTEEISGRRRRSQTPKQEGPALQDLSGFKELFQTPRQATDLMSAQPGPVQTPAGRKARRKMSLGKEDVPEEPLTPRGLAPQTPTGNVKGIKQPMRTPKQKLDLIESLSGHRRRPQTPKAKDQALEDLTGVRELFLTPGHTKDPKSGGEATEISCRWQQLEPANTPTSTKKRRKTSLRNEEETSGQKKRTRMSGEAAPLPKAPVGDDKSFEVSKIHAEQKVDPASRVTDSKSQRGTHEESSQPVEDLAGFKELFQTPGHARTPCNAREFVQTPASLKSSHKRSLGKVQEELPALQPTRALDRAPPTPLPMYDVQDVGEFMHTPKQKLQPVENLSGRRGRSQTPQVKEQNLEDLTGFRELFLTPGHTEESESGGENMQIPCQSPQAELETASAGVRTPPKTPAATVGLEELSARLLTHAPRGTVLTPKEVEDDDRTIRAFRKSAKQKAEPSTRVPGRRRPSKSPREKTQHLEDLTGFKELFQTPGHTESLSDGRSTRISCKFPALENTPVSMKAWSKTPGRKVGLEELMPVDTLKTSEGDMYADTSKGSSKQRLDLTGSVANSRRWPRTPKEKDQPEEDLAGLRELFQTPARTEESKSDGKTAGMSCTSEQQEPVSSPTSKRHLEIDLTDLNVPEESSVHTNCAQMSRKATYTPKVLAVPEGCEKEVRKLKGSAKRKLDSETRAIGGKRQRETPKDKFQPLEDLDGFKELFQTPVHTEKPTSDVKATETTELSCSAPDPGSTQSRTRRQRKIQPEKADVKEEISTRTRRKLPQPSGEPTPVPGTPDEEVRALEDSKEQSLELAESVIGNRRQPRASKKKTQPLEHQDSFKGLSPTSGHMEELTVGVHTFKEIPKPTPHRGKSPEMLRKALRASRVKPVEDPAELQSTNNPSLAPQSGCGEDGSLPRTKKWCSVATPQEPVAKRPANKRRRSASREKEQSPQPETTAKRLRTSAEKIAENLNTQDNAAKQEEEETSITPNKGMPARRRCQNKMNVEEGQRLRFLLPAENIKMKKNEVSEKQELQKPDEGAERLGSRGRRARSRKQNTAAVKESSTRVHRPVKTESGLPAAAPSGPRVRLGADSVGRTSEQRMTRGGRRRAPAPDTDKDILYTKTMRTRRHREDAQQ